MKCEKGGKGVKIAGFSTEKSIGVFAECDTPASFNTQLGKFVSEERVYPEYPNQMAVSETPVPARSKVLTPSSYSSVNKTPETLNTGRKDGKNHSTG